MIDPIQLKKVFILVHLGSGNPILRQCGHFDTRRVNSEHPNDGDWFYLECGSCRGDK